MNSEFLAILDQAFRGSLFVFLGVFLFLAVYSWRRLRRSRRGLGEMIQREVDPALGEALGLEAEAPPRLVRPSNRLRPLFYCFLLAGVVGVLSFAVLAFSPLPFLHNFATEEAWKKTPLRLTAVDFDRFFEGFSLEGELWNQSEEEIRSVTAAIQILDGERQLLDEITVEVTPAELQPATTGRFELRYTENSPLIYGYRLQFRDADGNLIPHVEGFEIR